MINSLATYCRVNKFGYIESPYKKVINGKVTSEIKYLSAIEEEKFTIAQANSALNSDGSFAEELVACRKNLNFELSSRENIDYIDVSPKQLVSVAAALIPFLENDDANRALMGSNMMRQAVPLMKPESPIVGTGMEYRVAKDSRSTIVAEGKGTVIYVDANKIEIKYDLDANEKLVSFDEQSKTYELIKFRRTNQDTCINLTPTVKVGDKVKKGQVICEGFATQDGELALGRNLKVAFMPWKGYNFEDAIVISEKVVKEDVFTSLHIEEFKLEVRDTKRGEEEFTNEIPNVSDEAIKDLDENGLIRVGAKVKEGDILIGKITPKGESDPTPEERLLRAIFGDKAGDVKDSSLKAPPTLNGVVVETKLFTRQKLSLIHI